MQPKSALEQLTAPVGLATGEAGCEAQRSKDYSPKRRKRPWRAVALDNDETTGSWGRASLLYRLWVNVVGRKPSVDDFVDHYLAYGGARPGLANLLRELDQLKQNGSIDEVVMFTSASDKDGWVSFLKECLERFGHTPGLFGRVLSMQGNSARAANGRMLKDLSLVSPDPFHVVLVDDKPEYAWKGYVIGVPEYSANVPINKLVAKLVQHVPSQERRSEVSFVLRRDHEIHPPSTQDFSEDDYLQRILPALKNVFVKNKSETETRRAEAPSDLNSLKYKRVKTTDMRAEATDMLIEATPEVTIRA